MKRSAADESLDAVVLPDGLETIGSRAFAGSGVTSVNLPASLTYIADDAFEGTNLVNVDVEENCYAYRWAVEHGFLGWEWRRLPDDTIEILAYSGNLSTIMVPSRISGYPVKSIGSQAFSGNPSMRSVSVPDGVTDIGNKAFYDCPKLREVNLPDTVRSIGTQLFCYCPQLTRVNIPIHITELPRAMFMCPSTVMWW